MRRILRYASFMAAVVLPAISILAQPNRNAQLNSEYRKWLGEDVRWIITNQERTSFLHLKNDEDRDRFVAEFWEQRNPAPGSQPNPFKEEHYRRIAFANEHFAASTPGWKSDRGRYLHRLWTAQFDSNAGIDLDYSCGTALGLPAHAREIRGSAAEFC